MRIFPPPLAIADKEGFRRDIFGRAKLGHGLTNLLSTVNQPLVLALDGEWGSGKTTFLRMWAGALRIAEFPVIYFDAFENDYADDAFTALAGKIISLATDSKRTSAGIGERFLGKAIGAGKVLLRGGAKLGIKAATMGALSDTDFSDIASELGKEASDVADKYLEELLRSQRDRENTLQAFKDSLSELPHLLTSSEPVEDGSQYKPLVFIIDELDRCRPTFALQILERMKHFFSVENVHFILGTNLTALCNTVILSYGPQTDARTYLQKFIDLTFYLTDDSEYEHDKVINKFIAYLSNILEFKPEDQELIRDCSSLIRYVSEKRNISLRGIEKIFSNLALALAFTGTNRLRLPPILAGLCIIKAVDPVLYVKAKLGTLVYTEVVVALAFDVPAGKGGPSDFDIKWWRYCTDPEPGDEILNSLGQIMGRYSFSAREKIVPFTAEIIDKLREV